MSIGIWTAGILSLMIGAILVLNAVITMSYNKSSQGIESEKMWKSPLFIVAGVVLLLIGGMMTITSLYNIGLIF